MFEILQHTADVRLRVRADSVEGLFRDAMLGMFAIMGSPKAAASRRTPCHVESIDRTSLLVDFLNEVLSRAQIESVAFSDVTFDKLTETEAIAQLRGGPAEFTQDIKAVTYHEAEVRETGGCWGTMLVFDI